MSEIRLTPPGFQPTLTSYSPLNFSSQNSLPLPDSNSSSLGQPQPLATLFANPTWASPDLLSAMPLIGVQASAASMMTGFSEEAQPSDGVDGRKLFKGGTTANAILKAATRATSRLGSGTRAAGSVLGLVGSAIALPGSVTTAREAIGRALETGERSDVAHASASTTSAASTGTRLVKHSLETYSLGAKTAGTHLAKKAATQAFKQAAPNASKAVLSAATKAAGKAAMGDLAAKAARRGTTAAATSAAKAGSTLAHGAGAVGRSAAKKVLQEGGEAAAKAAAKAVAKGGLKTAAKTAGRFVPGLNIGIAALDTATAAATLADPKASTGKKVTSVITAAGSIVAATNIPVVSTIGAAVSTVSSFVGSFF